MQIFLDRRSFCPFYSTKNLKFKVQSLESDESSDVGFWTLDAHIDCPSVVSQRRLLRTVRVLVRFTVLKSTPMITTTLRSITR